MSEQKFTERELEESAAKLYGFDLDEQMAMERESAAIDAMKRKAKEESETKRTNEAEE